MAKKITKTIEQLTEEFFTVERAEYEKRVPAAFPRVAVKAFEDPAGPPEFEDSPPAPAPPEFEDGPPGPAEEAPEDMPPVQMGLD